MELTQKILIIEKDEAEITKLKTALGEKYSLESVSATTEALKLLEKSHQDYLLAIINLDMPLDDGYRFCLSVKKDLNINNIPLIVAGSFKDFSSFEIPKGLRATDYDKIKKPYDNKLVSDIIEINIEKKKMLDRLTEKNKLTEETHMTSLTYFKELVELELKRAEKLNTSLNIITIKTYNDEIKENLLSVIKSTYRQTDACCICDEIIYFLMPNSNDIEGEMIVSRFNSVIYGLQIQRYLYFNTKTTIEDFKTDIWGHTIHSF